MNAIKRHFKLLFDTLIEIFVIPIREAAPKPRTWPAGLGMVMILITTGYLIGIFLVMAAPVLLDVQEPMILNGTSVITRATMTIVTWLASIILAAGLTAALHVHIGLRIVGLVFLLSPLTPLLALRPVACLLGIAGILLFFLIRARGRFSPWEFPVLWLLVGTALLLPLDSDLGHAVDMRSRTISLVITLLNGLAAPVLLLAGYTAAQLSTSVAQWLGYRATETMSRPVLVGLALLLGTIDLGNAVWSTVVGLPRWTPEHWLGSALLMSFALAIILLLRSALPLRGRTRRDPADPGELNTSWEGLAYGLAGLILAPLLLNIVLTMTSVISTYAIGRTPGWLSNLLASDYPAGIIRLVQAVVAFRLGLGRAHQGDRVALMVLGAYAAVMVFTGIPPLLGGWVSWEVDTIGALLVVTMLLVWLTNPRSGGEHQMLVMALLVSAYRFREVLSDPTSVFIGSATSWMFLVCLLWRAAADGSLTHGDSPTLPRPSRVLGYGAMILLGITTLAINAQARATDSYLDQAKLIQFGDYSFGTALFLAAGFAALFALRRAGAAGPAH